MHEFAYCAVAQMLNYLSHPPRRVLEIGSRDINGSVRALFPHAEYLGIDLVPGPGVDLVVDAARFVPPVPPDAIVCCEVLEHCPGQAEELIAHAASLLAPGGALLVTCATDPRTPHSAVDGGPLRFGEAYANVTPEALRAWIVEAGLTLREFLVRPDRGDLYACAVRGEA